MLRSEENINQDHKFQDKKKKDILMSAFLIF